MTHWTLIMGVVLAAGAGTLPAQTFETASNPYQAEFDYTIDSEVRPEVEVEGVRWRMLKVSPKKADNVRSGESITTFIEFDFENTRGEAATVAVVVLFEDAQGNGLDRVECDPEKVRGEEARSFRQKVKLQGDVLLATAKLYLFCEVQR